MIWNPWQLCGIPKQFMFCNRATRYFWCPPVCLGMNIWVSWCPSVCLGMNKRTLPAEHKELSINLVCPFACRPTPATFRIQKYRNGQTNFVTQQHLPIQKCVWLYAISFYEIVSSNLHAFNSAEAEAARCQMSFNWSKSEQVLDCG